MARPTFRICDIHICVLLEDEITFNWPFLLPTYPLIFVHATEPMKVTTWNAQRLHIINAIKYSSQENYTIWEIPITDDRIISLERIDYDNNIAYTNLVDNIVNAIEHYNIVYFKNLPFNYPKLFNDVSNLWSTQRKSNPIE